MIDTTADGRPDTLAVDTVGDGVADTMIPMGLVGGGEGASEEAMQQVVDLCILQST